MWYVLWGQKCRLRNVKIRMQKFLISFSAAGLLGFLELTTTPIKHLQSHWKKYSFLLIREHKPYENSSRFLVKKRLPWHVHYETVVWVFERLAISQFWYILIPQFDWILVYIFDGLVSFSISAGLFRLKFSHISLIFGEKISSKFQYLTTRGARIPIGLNVKFWK